MVYYYWPAGQLNDVYECVIYNAGVFNVNDLNSMVQESLKMSKFSHPNVMKLIGVCIDMGGSPYIVMPYMIYGSLLSYLKKHRAELTIANDDNSELARIGMHA